jgi:hypothetical protein
MFSPEDALILMAGGITAAGVTLALSTLSDDHDAESSRLITLFVLLPKLQR